MGLPVATRVRLVVSVAVAAASLCVAAAALHVAHGPAVSPWRIAVLACLLPLSEAALLHVRLGGDSMSFTWGEACVLVGFAAVSPSWLVLLAGPCVVAAHLLNGRGLLKASFNAASFTLAASAAAAVLEAAVSGPYSMGQPADAVALGISVLVFSLTSALLTGTVVAVAQGITVGRSDAARDRQ